MSEDVPHLIRKRGSHGLGLFTTTPIQRGTQIIEYTGDRISMDEANQRGGQYLFTVNKNLVIDGTGRANLARYINHSCRPNCYAEIDETESHVYIFAKRNIKAGEELSYNYGKEFWRTYIDPKGCRCSKCQPQ